MRFSGLALCLGLCVLTTHAQAAARLVLLQRAGASTAIVEGALQRIAAELRLEGYAPRFQPPLDAEPSVERLLETATQEKAFGALVLLNLPEQAGVRVFSFDGTKRTWVQRTLPVEAEGDAASVLSIRAVEIMRAHFLERLYNPTLVQRSQPLAPAVQPRPLGPRPWEGGVGLAHAFEPSSAGVWAPHLWASWSLSRLSVKASVLPSVTSFFASDTAGAAKVSQQAAWFSAAYHLLSRGRPSASWAPYVAAHAGAARLQAQGSADLPFRGTSPAYVTALLGAGAGCVWWASSRWGLSWSADVLWFASAAAVQIDGIEQHRLGQPQFVAAMGGVFAWGQR